MIWVEVARFSPADGVPLELVSRVRKVLGYAGYETKVELLREPNLFQTSKVLRALPPEKNKHKGLFTVLKNLLLAYGRKSFKKKDFNTELTLIESVYM